MVKEERLRFAEKREFGIPPETFIKVMIPEGEKPKMEAWYKSHDELEFACGKDRIVIFNETKRGRKTGYHGRYERLQRLGEYTTTCPYCGKEILIPTYRAVPITLEEHKAQLRETLKQIKQLSRGKKDE